MLAEMSANPVRVQVKERELIDIFSDKVRDVQAIAIERSLIVSESLQTYQQIRSIEAAFDSRYERSLSERINSEKSLRGNRE